MHSDQSVGREAAG